MSSKSISPSIQDYSLIKTYIDKAMSVYEIEHSSLAFYYFALDLLLNLQEDEIDDAITDSFYLESKEKEDSGHDRGIDAVFIDSGTIPCTIHLFNFKYTNQFKNTTNHYPAKEIDKIIIFLRELMQEDRDLINEVNKFLYSKVEEIWSIFNSQNPNFVIHLCCNFYNGLEEKERRRFEKEISKFSNIL